MPDRFALVLAGGRGERFWPWSRPERPKQLLPLAAGGRTLVAATVERALRLVPGKHLVVLTAADLRDAVRTAAGAPDARVLGEVVGRNTAPAVAAAATLFSREANDPAFVVMPADAAIDDTAAFVTDLERGFAVAEREPVLVTFGIRPSGPETNFGYIRVGDRLADRLHRVARFTEKPDRERAAAWLAEGGYLWNSGIFVWRCSTFLNALEVSRPDLAGPLRALKWPGGDRGFEQELARVFPALESISVDYAVLEGAPNTVVLEAAFDWDDLGSWSAWARRQARDARGNVSFGNALALDCDGCVVVGDGRPAVAMGLRDMVVVHAEGGTLVCRLDEADRVRRVTEALRARGQT